MCYGPVVESEGFSLAREISAYLREASVLVLVFGFLDPLASGTAHGGVRERLSAVPGDWAVFVLVVSLFLLVIGMFLDWIRRP